MKASERTWEENMWDEIKPGEGAELLLDEWPYSVKAYRDTDGARFYSYSAGVVSLDKGITR